MKNLRPTLRTAAVIAIAALIAQPLAGCSGTSGAVPPSGMSPALPAVASSFSDAGSTQSDAKKKKKTLLFVSDNANNQILVYDASSKKQHPSPIRRITQGVNMPNGIATDGSGNLYVANYYANDVTVYAPNASTPKTTIRTGLNGPWDVKVDGSGNVYVANIPRYGSAANFIIEYPAGSGSPSTSWQAPSGMQISGFGLLNPMQPSETSIYALAFSENSSGYATGSLLSCYPGDSNCQTIDSGAFGQTGGLAVSESPIGSKPLTFLAVDLYIPGVDFFTSDKRVGQLATGGTPEFITMNSAGTAFFVADRAAAQVEEYSYSGNKLLNTFPADASQSALYGVATSPSGTLH